jgi:hypothetical protein
VLSTERADCMYMCMYIHECKQTHNICTCTYTCGVCVRLIELEYVWGEGPQYMNHVPCASTIAVTCTMSCKLYM